MGSRGAGDYIYISCLLPKRLSINAAAAAVAENQEYLSLVVCLWVQKLVGEAVAVRLVEV